MHMQLIDTSLAKHKMRLKSLPSLFTALTGQHLRITHLHLSRFPTMYVPTGSIQTIALGTVLVKTDLENKRQLSNQTPA